MNPKWAEYADLDDDTLLLRYQEGDVGVLDYLMEKYKWLVRQKARTYYLIGQDSDDLIQEGMIGLFKAVRDYRQEKEASFPVFARLCVERQIANAIQHSLRQKYIPLDHYLPLEDNEDPGLISHEDNPEWIYIGQEDKRALEEKIERILSPREKRVLTLFLEGESYVGISRHLNISVKAVDNAIQRIRKKIRDSGDYSGSL